MDKAKKREYDRKYYQEHREEIIKRVSKTQKDNGYAAEKTVKQKFLRNIKRLTRYHFPLDKKFCEYCGSKATEHHHNTYPIKFDKFEYVCHECHQEAHNTRRRQ